MPDAASPAGSLSDLPVATGGIAAATARGARAVTEASARRIDLASGAPATFVGIRAVRAEIQVFFDRDGDQVILFFIHRKLPGVRSMSARLRFSVAPVQPAPPGDPLPPSSAAPAHYLILPGCLIASPTKDDLASFAPGGTTRENGVLLRIGPGGAQVLAVKNPGEGLDAEVAYTLVQRSVLQRPWLAKPFLDLVETLRLWVSGAAGQGTTLRLDMSSDPAGMPHTKQVLHHVARGFLRAEASAAEEAKRLPDEPWAQLVPRYAPVDYAAEIDLRLDASGKLAGPEVERPVSLGLRSSVARESGAVIARTELLPLDFVAEGPLLESFLGEVRGKATQDLLEELDMSDEGWGRFVDAGAERAAVFRANAETDDTHVLVLPGSSRRTLVLGLAAEVASEASPPAVTVASTRVLYDPEKSDDKTLDDEAALQWMSLVASFQGWLALSR